MLNTIAIMGRMTRDPELRRIASGRACTTFTLAVDRDIPNSRGEKETDFIDCVVWGKEGEFVAKYFKKGQMAVASGRLQVRTYKDRENKNRRVAEVVADVVYFGSDKRESGRSEPSYAGASRGYGYGTDYGNSGYSGTSGRDYGGPPVDPDYQIHDDFVNDMMDDDDAQLPF